MFAAGRTHDSRRRGLAPRVRSVRSPTRVTVCLLFDLVLYRVATVDPYRRIVGLADSTELVIDGVTPDSKVQRTPLVGREGRYASGFWAAFNRSLANARGHLAMSPRQFVREVGSRAPFAPPIAWCPAIRSSIDKVAGGH